MMLDGKEKTAGQRYSKQREVILKVVRETQSHPNADWVYEQVRLLLPNVSLGTVYRNLNLLADEGKIKRVTLDDGIVRFDGKVIDHHHFICTKSGKIFDVELPLGEALLETFNKHTGLNARTFKIEFYGEKE